MLGAHTLKIPINTQHSPQTLSWCVRDPVLDTQNSTMPQSLGTHTKGPEDVQIHITNRKDTNTRDLAGRGFSFPPTPSPVALVPGLLGGGCRKA